MQLEEELHELSRTMVRLAEAEGSWKAREEELAGKMHEQVGLCFLVTRASRRRKR
jgi:hypothetical protein